MIAQQADHDLGRLARPRIGISVLLRRQTLVRSRPRPDEGGSQQRLAHGIHQAEPDRLDEAASLVEGAQGRTVQAPLLAAKLIEFVVSHKSSF